MKIFLPFLSTIFLIIPLIFCFWQNETFASLPSSNVDVQGDWQAAFLLDPKQSNISQVESVRFNFQPNGTVFYEITVYRYDDITYSTSEGTTTETGHSIVKPGRTGIYKVRGNQIEVKFKFVANDTFCLGPFMVKGKKIFSNEPARLILEVKRADEHLIIYGHDRIPNITLAKGGSPYQNKSRFTNPIDLDNINAKKEKRKTAQEENEYFAVAQSPQTEINTIPPIALAFCPLKLKKTRTARTLKKLFTTTVNWVLKCRSKITNATA